MSVPDWWEALLLGVAAWRTFQLIGEDDILDTPRRYVTDRLSEYWQDFLTCPYCSGAWLSLGVYLFWLWQPELALAFGTVCVLNVVVIAGNKLLGT